MADALDEAIAACDKAGRLCLDIACGDRARPPLSSLIMNVVSAVLAVS